MNERTEITELAALLRSQVPIILIQTHEEPRILKLLEQAGNLEGQMLFQWSIVDGIRRLGRDESIYNTNELIDALKHVDKTPQNGVYVFCDAHPGFRDPVIVRLIRETALEHFKTARTLVFVSPKFDELPSELLRLAAHFRPHLPTREDIRTIIRNEAQLWQSRSGEKPRGDRAVIDQITLHLMGLEQDDVRRLVRQAFRTDGELNAADLRRILSTKHEALGGAGALGFEASTVKFDQLGGLAKMKHWVTLRRVPFMESSVGDAVDMPRGIVLLGVQGGGKSLAARAIAGEWNVPLMRLDFGALYNKYHGETERNLRQAFAAAEGMAPCVLWIDEIEKGVSTGSGDNDGGVSRRVLGALLTWLAERRRPVFIVATANDISQLPPELIRKGRFDEIFFVDFPNAAARRQIFAIHLGKRALDVAAFDLPALVAATGGFSGAEIEQAVIAASFEARAAGRPVDMAALLGELSRTRPLSVVMAERVEALRRWATDRAVMADDPAATSL